VGLNPLVGQHRAQTRAALIAATERELGKVQREQLADGSEIHSFRTLLAELFTIVRNTCRRRGAGSREATFSMGPYPAPASAGRWTS
jgi:hypothetical protein